MRSVFIAVKLNLAHFQNPLPEVGNSKMNAKTKLTPDEIKLRLRAVCICKGIKMGRICDAIQSGCKTVADVNKSTGSGSGGCGATRCRPVIEQLIANGGIPLASTPVQYDEDDDLLPY